MLELLASKGVGSFMGGLGSALGGGGGPTTSGAPVDARSFMDGSGWVVSTGSSRASGGDRTQGEGFGPTSNPQAAEPMQAGIGSIGGIVLLLVVAGAIWKKAAG